MTVVWTILGMACIFFVVRDLFQALFHPAARGAMSDAIAARIWSFVRRFALRKRKLITLAGPLAILSVMASWVLLACFGFALIYFPHMATQYAVANGMDPEKHKTFFDAVNVSLGGMVTLGGDINPKSHVLRFLLGLEGVMGFGVLTASVSWLLSIYPILERRRTVAHQATLLHNAELQTSLRLLDQPSAEAHQVIWGIAAELAGLRNELMQFPITYYFHSGDTHSGFPGALPYLYDLAAEASISEMPSLRLAGTALGGAIEDYLNHIASNFLHMPPHDKRAILERYAEDHLRPIMRESRPPGRRAA
jgi:hypothetical protein